MDLRAIRGCAALWGFVFRLVALTSYIGRNLCAVPLLLCSLFGAMEKASFLLRHGKEGRRAKNQQGSHVAVLFTKGKDNCGRWASLPRYGLVPTVLSRHAAVLIVKRNSFK